MKRLTFLLAFALIFFYGCNKQETNPAADNQQVGTSGASTWILNLEGETPVWEFITISDQHINPGSATLKQGNSAHAHGNITGFGGPGYTTFSGTQNNGGAHGSAEIQFSAQGGNLHIKLETASVVVLGDDGNEAIYGGLITEVIENTIPQPPPPPPPPPPPGGNPPPPPPPPPACDKFELGTYVYIVVKDNGQGNNAPLDEYRPFIYSTCDALSDGGKFFPWFLFGWVDVSDESDKIKVN